MITFVSGRICGWVALLLVGTATCTLVMGKSKESNLFLQLREQYSNDLGVYDIRETSEGVSIFCISSDERQRILTEIRKSPQNADARVIAPLWTIGELVPDNDSKYLKALQDPDASRVGTNANNRRVELRDELIRADEKIWTDWSKEERLSYIRKKILQLRKLDSSAANCGDKFLANDKYISG